MKTYLIVINHQGAQITSNALCGQPVVWAFDASNGLDSDLDVRQVARTFIDSQPLPQNFTKNSTLFIYKEKEKRRPLTTLTTLTTVINLTTSPSSHINRSPRRPNPSVQHNLQRRQRNG